MKRFTKLAVAVVAAFSILGCAPATSPSKSDTNSSTATSGYVKGVITAKGSIWVDGVEYETTDAQVSVDGEPGDDAALQVGMTVEFEATVDSKTGKGIAKTVAYESSLKGLVDVGSIDVNLGTFTVAGQTVQSGVLTVWEGLTDVLGLTPGQFVEVSGQLDASVTPAVLLADRIEVKAAEDYQIKGKVTALDTAATTTLTVVTEGGKVYTVTITDSAPLDASVVVGAAVRVKFAAAPTGESLDQIATTAAKISVKKSEVRIPENGRMELHGIVANVVTADDETTFTLAGQAARVTKAVLNRNGNKPQTLVNGAKVELKGILNADKVLEVNKIEVKKSESEMKAEMKEVEGTVKAVDLTTRTLTVTDKDKGTDVVLTVSSTTLFRGSLSGTDPLAKLAVGASVEAKYLTDADGVTLVAAKVEVKGADGEPEGDDPEEDHPEELH